MIKCGKCGNELLRTDVACSSCQTPILELKQTNNIIFEKDVVKESTPVVDKPIKTKNNLPKYIGVLLVLMLLVVGGYFLSNMLFTDKDENTNVVYNPGKVTDREIISYLKYKTPEAWSRNTTLDETYSYEVDYFDYKDKKSTIFLKVITPQVMDPVTKEYVGGVDKEQWINNISYILGVTDVKHVDEIYDGVTWTKIYGEMIDENQNKFLKATYMYISQDGNDLYSIETKQLISTNEVENKELSDSINYILANAKPQK